MSNSRAPLFWNMESAACSRKTAAGLLYENDSRQPIRQATSANIHQSGRPAPGAERNARWREMQRSEFVTVPSFSAQVAAGKTMSARALVSVAHASETTTNGQVSRARRIEFASGMLAAGLVAAIQIAF